MKDCFGHLQKMLDQEKDTSPINNSLSSGNNSDSDESNAFKSTSTNALNHVQSQPFNLSSANLTNDVVLRKRKQSQSSTKNAQIIQQNNITNNENFNVSRTGNNFAQNDQSLNGNTFTFGNAESYNNSPPITTEKVGYSTFEKESIRVFGFHITQKVLLKFLIIV